VLWRVRRTVGRSDTRRVAAGSINIGASGRSADAPEEGGRDNADVAMGIPGGKKMLMLVHDVATWSASCRALVGQNREWRKARKRGCRLRRSDASPPGASQMPGAALHALTRPPS
jgi:hypothetical protein